MQEFEKQLEQLINAQKGKKKPDVKEIEAVVSGLVGISEEDRKKIMEPLKSKCENPIIYQIIAGFLAQDSSAQMGMELFSYCCDKITDNGKKGPGGKIVKSMKAAFAENALKILLEKEMSKSIMICLLHLIFKHNLKEGRSLLVNERAILNASKLWEELIPEERETYANCIKHLFKGKTIDGLLINKESKKIISSEFMKAVSLSDKEDSSSQKNEHSAEAASPSEEKRAKPESTSDKRHSAEAPSEEKKTTEPESASDKKHSAEAASPPEEKKATEPETASDKEYSAEAASPSEEKKAAKPESASNKKEPQPLPSQQQAKPSFDPVQAMDDIVAWLEESPVLQAKKLFEWVEKNDDAIRGYRETEGKLRREIDSLKADNTRLKNELKNSEQIIDKNKDEINGLNKEIESKDQYYQERMKTVGNQIEEREKRAVREMKNRIASRLQPIIDQFGAIQQGNSLTHREEGLTAIFNTMINTLKQLLDIQVNR